MPLADQPAGREMHVSCPPRCPSCGESAHVRRIGEVFTRWPRSRELAARYAHLEPPPPRPLSPRRPCSCGCLLLNVLTLSVVLLTVPLIDAFANLGYVDHRLLLVAVLPWLGALVLGLVQAVRRRRDWQLERAGWQVENADWQAHWYCWPCNTAFVPLPLLPTGSYTGQTVRLKQ